MPRPIRSLCLLVGAFLLLATRANAASITLAWNANPDPGVTGYYVVYGTASRSYPGVADAGNRTQFQIPNLTNGRTYYFAVLAHNAAGETSDFSNEVSALVGPVAAAPGDFAGDGTADFAVFRPATGMWLVQGQANVQWGIPGDIPVPGDYNGDGRAEIAVFRPATGVWYLQQSGAVIGWGRSGDIPVPGDYNGDGTTDLAVFRTSDGGGGTWFIRNIGTFALGLRGDIPVPADYDGDGKTDFAVFRPSTGTWYIVRSSDGSVQIIQWGISTDLPVTIAN
jgi:hypothetical protein